MGNTMTPPPSPDTTPKKARFAEKMQGIEDDDDGAGSGSSSGSIAAKKVARSSSPPVNISTRALEYRTCLSCSYDSIMSSPVPPMPWFGMDIGGTLVKLVYFEPTDTKAKATPKSEEENSILNNIRRYLTKNKAYGDSGHRDAHLQMDDVTIDGRRGSLHFIRFPTSAMDSFLELAKEKGMAKLASTVCATGGGAYKFQELIEKEVSLKLHKFDEIHSLIRGVEFMEKTNQHELYFYAQAQDEERIAKTPYASGQIYPFMDPRVYCHKLHLLEMLDEIAGLNFNNNDLQFHYKNLQETIPLLQVASCIRSILQSQNTNPTLNEHSPTVDYMSDHELNTFVECYFIFSDKDSLLADNRLLFDILMQ
jgi:hypothetical protein